MKVIKKKQTPKKQMIERPFGTKPRSGVFGKEAKFREEPKGEGEKQKQTSTGCGFRLQRIYKLARVTCT